MVLTEWRKGQPQGSKMDTSLHLIPFPNHWNLVPSAGGSLQTYPWNLCKQDPLLSIFQAEELCKTVFEKRDPAIFPTCWARTLA